MAILGRRSGKTTLAIEDVIDSCWSNPKPEEWPIAYIAPTYKQAKRITWGKFKQHFNKGEAKYNVSELTITHLPTGCKIMLFGCDANADSLRGIGLWHSVVDEIKDISEQFLQEVLRPCFSDSGAGCLYIGTPGAAKGTDYKLFQNSKQGHSGWRGWNKSSIEAGILSAEEIAEAKATLDPDVFQREYGAAFSFRQGLVVKHFSTENIQPVEFERDHRVHISCDFNVDPCMWVVAHRFPPRYHFFDEIVKENTTIVEMCDEFARRYPPEVVQNGITINGDASGNNRNVNTERKNETSYTIMRNRLSQLGYNDIRIAVRPKNPGIQDRIEAFNAKVMNANGESFIYINQRCKHLINNLENLRWIEGSSDIWEPTAREIQKDRNLKFTKHIYDAASYLVEFYDPIRHEQHKEAPSLWVPDLELSI